MYKIINKGNKQTEILLYGGISYWGKNSAENLSNKLRELDAQNDIVTIRINSPGGDVMEAGAIYSTIKSMKAKTIAIIDGIAASAASFILLAFDEVQISRAGRIMLHKFSGGAYGNSIVMRQVADTMDAWEKDWVAIYAEKMGMTVEATTSEYFQPGKDTWISPADAVKLKLADKVIDGIVKEAPETLENLSAEVIAATYQNQLTNQNSYSMKKEHLILLGLNDNATEAEITAAITELKSNATKAVVVASSAAPDAEKEELKTKLANIEKSDRSKMIQAAIDSKKIVADAKADFEAIGEKMGNDHLKNMLDKLTPASLPTDLINKQSPDANKAEYKTLTDLYKAGEAALAKYKAENPTEFNALWKAEYGTDYTESL